MKCSVYNYEIPWGDTIRRGLLVKLGEESFGEIAPLPGWSKESLADALEELKSGRALSPSVQFGLESAYLSLTPPKLPLSVPICPLLMGSAESILKEAGRRPEKIVKVKLSGLADGEAVDLLKELSKKFLLRVDLNRKWSLARSLKFFSHFAPEDFDFIEEPCDCVSDLVHFPFPLGVDESLRDTAFDELLKIPSLKALVFKPTLQGGVRVGKALAQVAAKHNLDLIFSASFESGVGISQIALLAHHLNIPLKPMGLDTYRYLKDDVLQKPLDFSESWLHLKKPLFEVDAKICSVPLLHLENVIPMLSHLQPMSCV